MLKERGIAVNTALLVADRDKEIRERMTDLFTSAGYNVKATGSALAALAHVVTRRPQVVVLGSEFDDLAADMLIPLLKKFNRDLIIILLSDEPSLHFLRKVRSEGIFYHALTPVTEDDWEEIRQVVDCAFDNFRHGSEKAERRPAVI